MGGKGRLNWEREERQATNDLQAKVAIIQDLIPLGLAAVADVLARKVEELVGTVIAGKVECLGIVGGDLKGDRFI